MTIWQCVIASAITCAVGMCGPVRQCAELAAVSFGKEVKIDSAKMVPATANTPEHCDVRGTIWPENRFALKLPSVWNNRFYMAGNGGTAGTISTAVDIGLRKGFAAASTDTGHDAAKDPQATFARRTPDNPNAERKLIDFAYLAVHETAVLSKQIIEAYYGERPRQSYWVGCSQGGRQGFMEAQRFPEDFDGLVIGAPSVNLTRVNMRVIWNAQAIGMGPGTVVPEKMPLLAAAVYKKCDGIDGLEDGLIDDPRRCPFDPARDLPRCPGDKDALNCFTSAQAEGLKKVYGGVKTSTGGFVFPGQPLGAEVLAPKSAWVGFMVGPTTGALERAESYMKNIFLDPLPDASWSYRSYNFDTDPQRMKKIEAQINPTNPNLEPLKRRGGKIIHYQGWADPGVNAFASVDYYESVLKTMGDAGTKEFYRLFMIPGMFHCRGGVGCDTVDWLTPIMDWVEKGRAPDRLLGARVEGGKTKRTRPLCPYPKVARYNKTGGIDEAASFTCVEPESGK